MTDLSPIASPGPQAPASAGGRPEPNFTDLLVQASDYATSGGGGDRGSGDIRTPTALVTTVVQQALDKVGNSAASGQPVPESELQAVVQDSLAKTLQAAGPQGAAAALGLPDGALDGTGGLGAPLEAFYFVLQTIERVAEDAMRRLRQAMQGQLWEAFGVTPQTAPPDLLDFINRHSSDQTSAYYARPTFDYLGGLVRGNAQDDHAVLRAFDARAEAAAQQAATRDRLARALLEQRTME